MHEPERQRHFVFQSSEDSEDIKDYNEQAFFKGCYFKTLQEQEDPLDQELLQIIRRYQRSFKLLSPSDLSIQSLKAPFLAFQIQLVPKCTKDEFNEASKNMIKAVYLAKDSLILDISFIRPKYKGKEKSPIVVVRNKELDVWLRQFLEELIQQMLTKLKDHNQRDQWLFSLLKFTEDNIHLLMARAIQKYLASLDNQNQENTKWTESEINRLEQAIRINKNIKDSSLWDNLAELVETRTPEECKQRCIELTQKVKNPQKNEQEQEAPVEEEPQENIHYETEEIKDALRIIEFYTKAKIEVQGLKMDNIGTVYMQSIAFQVQCLGCSALFQVRCSLLSLKHKLLHFESPCPKCNRKLKVIVMYDIMHLANLDMPAQIAFLNVNLRELRGVNYAFTCANCDKDYIAKNASLGELIDQNCVDCFAKLKLGFRYHNLVKVEPKGEPKEESKKGGPKGKKSKK